MAVQDADHVPLPAAADTVAVSEGSRALVAEVTTAAERTNVLVRPAAAFVAQLIATAADTPQTRMLRRAEPHDAVGAYGATPMAATGTKPNLSRLF